MTILLTNAGGTHARARRSNPGRPRASEDVTTAPVNAAPVIPKERPSHAGYATCRAMEDTVLRDTPLPLPALRIVTVAQRGMFHREIETSCAFPCYADQAKCKLGGRRHQKLFGAPLRGVGNRRLPSLLRW